MKHIILGLFLIAMVFGSDLLAQPKAGFKPDFIISKTDTVPTKTTHFCLYTDYIQLYDKLRDIDLKLQVEGSVKLDGYVESYQTTCLDNGLPYRIDVYYLPDWRTIRKITSHGNGSILKFTSKELIQ